MKLSLRLKPENPGTARLVGQISTNLPRLVRAPLMTLRSDGSRDTLDPPGPVSPATAAPPSASLCLVVNMFVSTGVELDFEGR